MIIFQLKPFSGHIQTVVQEAHRIAKAFPEHHFVLSFNDTDVTVTDRQPKDILDEYMEKTR